MEDVKIEDEFNDVYAQLARKMWDQLRATDFHDGRNRIAGLLRIVAVAAHECSCQKVAELRCNPSCTYRTSMERPGSYICEKHKLERRK